MTPTFDADKKTIFIFGAGASNPFGFPLGSELRRELVGLLHDHGVSNSLRARSVNVDSLRGILEHTPLKTIDTFLEKKPSHRQVVAELIVQAIRRSEENSVSRMFPGENMDHQYSELIDLLLLEDANARRDIGFITLNYDRSLEYFLARYLEVACGENDWEHAHENLRKIKINHPHGSLGNLAVVPYASAGDEESKGMAVKNLKIVADKLEEHPEFVEAVEMLSTTEQVIIIGFGYDERTVDRLFPPNETYSIPIWTTCIGMNSTKMEKLGQRFPNIIFDHNSYGYNLMRKLNGKS